MKQAMKRDSRQQEDFREKPFGARLYWNIAEPVLELCTDQLEGYTGNAHYSVEVFVIQVLVEVSVARQE